MPRSEVGVPGGPGHRANQRRGFAACGRDAGLKTGAPSRARASSASAIRGFAAQPGSDARLKTGVPCLSRPRAGDEVVGEEAFPQSLVVGDGRSMNSQDAWLTFPAGSIRKVNSSHRSRSFLVAGTASEERSCSLIASNPASAKVATTSHHGSGGGVRQPHCTRACIGSWASAIGAPVRSPSRGPRLPAGGAALPTIRRRRGGRRWLRGPRRCRQRSDSGLLRRLQRSGGSLRCPAEGSIRGARGRLGFRAR